VRYIGYGDNMADNIDTEQSTSIPERPHRGRKKGTKNKPKGIVQDNKVILAEAKREAEIALVSISEAEATAMIAKAKELTDIGRKPLVLSLITEGKPLSVAAFLCGVGVREVRMWRKADKEYDTAVADAEGDNDQRFLDYCQSMAKASVKDSFRWAVLWSEMKGLRVSKQEINAKVQIGAISATDLRKIVEERKKELEQGAPA